MYATGYMAVNVVHRTLLTKRLPFPFIVSIQVSMTTPKDGPTLSTVCAAFVELSLSREGFSCLFLPSVAPQSLSGPAMVGVVAADSVLGGIGAGDRVFPPQTG